MVFNVLLNKTLRSFLAKLLFSIFSQLVLLHGIVSSLLEDLEFGFFELHEIPDSPFLKPV